MIAILEKRSARLINEYKDYYNRVNAHKFKRKNDKLALKDIHTNFLVVLVKALSHQMKTRLDADPNIDVTSESILTLTHWHSYFKKDDSARIDKDKRTIRRYLDQLAAIGLIMFERDRYNQSCIIIHPDLIRFTDQFEVLITPVLCLCFDTEPAKLQKMQHADIQKIFLQEGVNLSPIHITGNSLNRQSYSDMEKPCHENTAQGNSITQKNTAQLPDKLETLLLETRKAAGKKIDAEKIQAGPRPKNMTEYAELRRRAIKQNQTRTALVNRLVVFLFTYVMENFYRDKYTYFDKSQEQIIINFYFDQFATVPDHRLNEVYTELHARNRKWKKFISANPDRFTPLPGKFYDLSYGYGFQITKRWLLHDTAKKADISARNQVDHQLRTVKKILEGKTTIRGKYLTLNERLFYANQITTEVEKIATYYQRPDLLHSYSRRLNDHIEKNPTLITL